MGPFAAFTARVSVALAVTTAALSVQGCGSGRPTIGSVRVTRVSRTNDTFLVEGSLNYAAGASDDPVKDVLCTVFPEGAVPSTSTVRDKPASLAGEATIPVPDDGRSQGQLVIAVTATGKEGRYEILCGAVSRSGLTSDADARTGLDVP
ncbi:MAG: hypothetical protein JNM74_02230 [Myxococcales bacterium]|jgi:hypothetical protein|nr:hypothetical protein [Myxococcales bacterium]